MSSLIDPEQYQDRLGTVRKNDLGSVTRLQVQRYARSVEDDNPLFHDPEYAREQGYDDVVVPPNFLSAIIGRGEGRTADQLREDGLDGSWFPIELPPEAILMGGGQSLTFDRYVTANESVRVEETLSDLYQKDSGGMGTLTFVEMVSEYFARDDERVVLCEETRIVGDRP